jgi:pyrimidine-nucleoside phosphorylase
MRAVDIIIKKRDKEELSTEEINFFIQGFSQGEIPDYQTSAWAMAVLLNGMSPRETADLTMALAHSGDMLDLSQVVPISVDKHSTGGVGDKTTLVVEPIVAACGLPVGKLSGRGLGFSGGTLDKIESIPGFRTDLTSEEFLSQLKNIGLVLTGQSADLAPADGKLYALRDVTGTVPSIPLIASSIMSKKIAGGCQAILLDVKVGSGAFIRTVAEARQLAELMISIGEQSGRKVIAVLSDMNQPLGCAVGNAMEVREAINTLHGSGPADFVEHCLVVSSYMLILGRLAPDPEVGRQMAAQKLADGSAWKSFCTLVKAQGGDLSYVEDPDLLPLSDFITPIEAEKSGYLSRIDAQAVGEASIILGAGRMKKEDRIDHAVGIEVLHKVGDRVNAGEPLLQIHYQDYECFQEARQLLMAGITLSTDQVDPLPLFYDIVGV